jgi:hypothetical protein
MWWSIGYVALLLYGGVMFVWLGTRDRWPAAIGLLLGLAGLQLGVMHRLPAALAVVIAGVGLALVAREAATTVLTRAQTRATLAPARVPTQSGHGER